MIPPKELPVALRFDDHNLMITIYCAHENVQRKITKVLDGWLGACEDFPRSSIEGFAALARDQARPANSRVSVDTLIFSPCLMKRGTRISMPVSSFAGLVTLPLAVSPRAPGSV